MNRDIEWELILRYLDGNSTHDDQIILNRWLNAGEENREHFEQIRSIWNVPAKPLPRPDTEQAWINIRQKAGIKDERAGNFHLFNSQKNTATERSGHSLSIILRVAAVLLLAIITPFLLVKIPNSPVMNKIRVPEGQVEQITLNDGSRITLDAGSILRYPDEFTGNTREVFLDGEGLFEVFPDSKKPFIVHANEAVITVLGTTFNVRTWSRSNQTTVAVVEGRVALTSGGHSSRQEGVIISKNQVSILPDNGSPLPPYNTDINRYLSWRQRQMYFQSAPLREVLDQLERWYGLKFKLPDASAADRRVTIFLEDKPVEEILEVIALINNFQYKQDGKKILFSRNEQS